MANYYKNGTALNQIITTTTFTSQNFFSNFVSNNPSYSSDFTNTIVETANTLNYKINGVDIAGGSIAYWVGGTQANGGITVPSWATKIRAVLIGAGGSGSSSILNQIVQQQNHNNTLSINQQNHHSLPNQQDNNHNTIQINDNNTTNVNNNNHYEQQLNQSDNNGIPKHHNSNSVNYNHDNVILQQQTNQNGGSGGGGGFIYLSDFTLNPLQIQVICGTGSTTLTIGQGQNIFTSNSGGNASGNQSGIGGSLLVQSTNQPTTTLNTGQSGQSTTPPTGGQSGVNIYSTNSTILTYGKGGYGGTGDPVGINGGQSGNTGYYRIYFLTN